MTASYSGARYSRPLIVLHWFTLLLLVGVYGFIEARELFEKGTDVRELMKAMHFMLGLTVLLTVMLRLFFRLRSNTPAIEPAPHWLMNRVAQLVHLLLYVLMIGMPIAGWMILSAAGKPVPFYGLELPALIAENKDLADTIKETHKTIGNLGYFLIAIHALAGVYHHHVRRDNTLLRMLPGRKN
ncbi:MAG: cytochrome B [Betaproteobacteria bacterium HGW-Betaproteobacteria-1]|jgi:cytochrome b561|nr:MAG: cytochrome B [Betaproteobacteria bacterium HGW-Betaproteobacteria-1]